MGRLRKGTPAAQRWTTTLEDGRAWPLGSSLDGDGVNFAVFSENATRIDLCIFDGDDQREIGRWSLPARSGDIWHGRLPGARAGLIYGLRAHGPWRPEHGQYFNPAKLLLDPWGCDIVAPPGGFDFSGPHSGATRERPDRPDWRDNGPQAHKSRVVALGAPPAWQRPRRAPEDVVILELHVRAFTRRMPGVPSALRGTYAGLASDAAIDHLRRLGVSTVCLLPVQQKLDEARLAGLGLCNHWGYNTLGFFCPEPRYAATDDPRSEFCAMVERLHEAGIEVILDVVYNHTAEGGNGGLTLSWRGLDNASWYRLVKDHLSVYENISGCGNTLSIGHPRVLQLVLDSLRHWVQYLGADGFRFDLAPVLGRDGEYFDRSAAFFKTVAQDPALQGVRLIAEPWDLGASGYQLGQFPRGWLEWNDRFRDAVRAFWLGRDATRGELALRLAGSADRFHARRRTPLESINYIVSHDGFNLADLVSYNSRHNEANGEDNRDGHAFNLSWNCGVEGPTDDADVLALRGRLKRALLATLLLSQGTPMLCAGDEMGHSQQGNNNPYCQDNAITWLDWEHADPTLIDFVGRLVTLRRRLLPFSATWYTGLVDTRGRRDLAWLHPGGAPMSVEQWNDRSERVVGALIGAPGIGDERLLMLFNAGPTDTTFMLPPGRWVAEFASHTGDGRLDWRSVVDETSIHAPFPLEARSVALLRDDGNHGPTP